MLNKHLEEVKALGLSVVELYVNALGEEDREPEVMFALEHAKGFLRREVAKRVRLRKAPELQFRWDARLERTEKINALLATLQIPPGDTVGEIETDMEDDDDDSELE